MQANLIQQKRDHAIDRKKLGPGFTCQIAIQNSNGTTDHSIHNGEGPKSLKLIQLYKVYQSNLEFPKLEWIIR